MGVGFKLNLKLGGSPLHSHFLTSPSSSSSLPSSYSSRGRESSYDSARLSSTFCTSLQSENMYNDLLKAHRCSSTSQTLENAYAVIEGIQIDIGKTSLGSLCMVDDKIQTSSQVTNSSHFGLLLENLDKLEAMSTDSDAETLERNILLQIERLGALKLFHTCLSRTLKSLTFFDLSDTPTQLIEPQMNGSVNVHKTIVCSRKKEERILKRQRALEKGPRLALTSKSIQKELNFYCSRRPANSRSRRLNIAKNEADMSRGVKIIDNLEKIRTLMEQETGRVATLTSWAKAAGVDVRVLQKQLHHGWYCREELLRSARSLVLYIARNYRGLGLALEDLIQAGNTGVLEGARRFDHTRGYRFSTYVQYWIRKSMSTLVAQHSRGIRIPFTLTKAINQIQKARKALNRNHQKYPEDDEIAKFTGLSLAKITAASNCLRVVGSIDQKMGDSISGKPMEFIPDTSIKSPEETVTRQHMVKELCHLLNTLEPRERQVLVLRFGLDEHHRRSLEEIGRVFSVSKEWIRRVERKALTKLRDEDFCRDLSHYIYL